MAPQQLRMYEEPSVSSARNLSLGQPLVLYPPQPMHGGFATGHPEQQHYSTSPTPSHLQIGHMQSIMDMGVPGLNPGQLRHHQGRQNNLVLLQNQVGHQRHHREQGHPQGHHHGNQPINQSQGMSQSVAEQHSQQQLPRQPEQQIVVPHSQYYSVI